jgi:hypothetical protein
MDLTTRLQALASGPKPWLITTTFADGRTRELRQPFEASARNYAERESRKIGKRLICRDTGATVMVVSVTVEHRPA